MGARIRYILTETLLWVAAAAGLLAILLVAAAYLFNISLIMFRTGSMEPTIPAGAVSVVQEVEASAVEVGDVLTIDRPGQLPVTHRVTSVEPGASTDERVITMRGDANDSDDPAPYVVTEAREVLWSVPGLANVVNQMGSPYVMGGVTMAASLLVGWAFWPAKAAPGNPSPASPRAGPARPDSRHRRRSRSHSGLLLLLLVLGTAGPLVVTPDAVAATHRGEEIVWETVSSDYLALRSAYVPSQRLDMSPGGAARWDIDVSTSPPETVQARTGLSMTGELPLGVTITACDQRWSDDPTSSGPPEDSCPGQADTLLDDREPDSSGVVRWLDRASSAQDLWLRVDTVLPANVAVPANASSIVRIHAEVAGDQISVSPGSDAPSPHSDGLVSPAPGSDQAERGHGPPPLAQTGGSFLRLLALALALIAIGRVLQKPHRASPIVGGEAQ